MLLGIEQRFSNSRQKIRERFARLRLAADRKHVDAMADEFAMALTGLTRRRNADDQLVLPREAKDQRFEPREERRK